MSGPKVVRIVTREELLAICEAHLARLDAAIKQWTKTGQRNDVLSDSDITIVAARRKQIAQLLKREDFIGVQKQVPLEIDFLKRDTQVRLDIATKKAFEARQRGRRNAQAGLVLLSALEKAGCDISNDLRRQLNNATGEGASIDAALSKAFALLNPHKDETATDDQTRLASQHAEGEVRQMFPEWLAKQADANTETFRKLDLALAELGTIADAKTTSALVLRAQALSTQPVDDRTSLLVDSLVIDVQTALKAARSAYEALRQLAELGAELDRYPVTERQDLTTRIGSVVAEGDIVAAQGLIGEIIGWFEKQKQAAASACRRQAMLKGLSELGYAVNEGLETLWAQEGKVVLRKAASPDYGVEIVSGQASKLQVRVVGFGSPGAARDVVRDRDMETIWCSEFGKLQASLADTGSDLVIEKALAVGATPVKVIASDAVSSFTEIRRSDTRTF